MKRYKVVIDLCGTFNLYIDAENIDEAEKIAEKACYDEDELIENHRNEIYVWNPEIDEIIEEEN